MEALKRKYDNFKKAYAALNRAVATQEELKSIALQNPDADDLFSSGVIQRFELAYETAWKFLKEYLKHVHSIDVASPKEVFRVCYTYRIFPEALMNHLVQLADARNKTTHIYNQILAKEVCEAIKKHQDAVGKILEFIQPFLNGSGDIGNV